MTDLPESQRLIFRRWSDVDPDLASLLWRDPEVMHFLGGPYSEEQVRKRLQVEIENDRLFGFQYWPIFVRDDGTFAGVCGLKPYKPESREHEIGFHLRPQFWRLGYASEGSRAVIGFASTSVRAHALYAGHHPQNEASRALLVRLGFECIGTHFFAPTGLDHPWYVLQLDLGIAEGAAL